MWFDLFKGDGLKIRSALIVVLSESRWICLSNPLTLWLGSTRESYGFSALVSNHSVFATWDLGWTPLSLGGQHSKYDLVLRIQMDVMTSAPSPITSSPQYGCCFCCCWVAKSCLSLVTPWTIAHQAPLSVGFPRQEYWSGFPFPSPGDLPDPGIRPASSALAGGFFTTELPRKLVWIGQEKPKLFIIFGGEGRVETMGAGGRKDAPGVSAAKLPYPFSLPPSHFLRPAASDPRPSQPHPGLSCSELHEGAWLQAFLTPGPGPMSPNA